MLANNDGMEPIDWGWAVQGNTLIPLMMKDSQTACSKWFTANVLQYAAQWDVATGNMHLSAQEHACQDGDCDNVAYKPVSDDDEDEA